MTSRPEPPEQVETCADCRFYRIDSSRRDEGYCHRYAPHPTFGVSIVNVETGKVDAYQWWPRVSVGDWCGEFEVHPKLEAVRQYHHELKQWEHQVVKAK